MRVLRDLALRTAGETRYGRRLRRRGRGSSERSPAVIAEHEGAISPSSTRRSATRITGSTWTAGCRRCSASSRASAGGCRRALQGGRHDARVDGRGRRRPALRDAVPAARAPRRPGKAGSTSPRTGPRRSTPRSSGVQARGKAELGDKTMIDALVPARDAFRRRSRREPRSRTRCGASADAAERVRDATVPLVARKGRASYLGERSAGHQDPGATSSALLLLRRPPRRGAARTERQEEVATDGGLRRRDRPGNDQHAVHDLRPRRQRGGASTRRSTSRSIRSRAGSSTTRWRSGPRTNEVIDGRAEEGRHRGGRPRRGRHHEPARDHGRVGSQDRQADLQRARLAGHADPRRRRRAVGRRRPGSVPRQGRACRSRRTSPARR